MYLLSISLLSLVLFSQSVLALTLPCEAKHGAWQQGDIMLLQCHELHALTVNQQQAMQTPEGLTLFGIGRDAKEIHLSWKQGNQQQTVTLPIAQRTYQIQHVDGLPNNKVNPDPKTLAKMKEDAAAIAQARKVQEKNMVPALPWAWPVDGRVSGVWGSQRVLNGQPRRPHFGVDIAAPEGTPIHAPQDGVVRLAAHNMVLTGETMLLDHGLGLKSIYVHMSKMVVRENEHVQAGQIIGYVGKTGRATGPHLHWGVSWFDVQVDPQLLVSQSAPNPLN